MKYFCILLGIMTLDVLCVGFKEKTLMICMWSKLTYDCRFLPSDDMIAVFKTCYYLHSNITLKTTLTRLDILKNNIENVMHIFGRCTTIFYILDTKRLKFVWFLNKYDTIFTFYQKSSLSLYTTGKFFLVFCATEEFKYS